MRWYLILLSSLLTQGGLTSSLKQFYTSLTSHTSSQEYGSDGCSKLVGQDVVSYFEAINCYNSFPLTKTVRNETLKTLQNTLEFYAFKDIIEHSPEKHIPATINLDNQLKALYKYKFQTEFEFHSYLSGFFNTLHDGHTRYTTDCFSKFKFNQPFPIYALGKRVFILDAIKHPDNLREGWNKLGVNITKFQGSQVIKINDMEPLDYLKLYSHTHIGTSRDINSRLNYALARTVLKDQVWGINHGYFAATGLVPVNNSIKFQLKTSDHEIHIVDAPYLAISPTNFVDQTSFYKKNCALQTSLPRSPYFERHKLEVPEILEIPISQPLKQTKSRQSNPLQDPLYNGTTLKAYMVGKETGVLVIPSFSLGGYEWYQEVEATFKAFQLNNVTKLILDLSNNGGGIICRGYNILRILFPQAKLFPTDMRSTPLLKKVISNKFADYFPPLDYDKLDSTPITEWNAFDKEIHYSRGKKINATYTPQFLDRCPDAFPNLNVTFKQSDIAVVTNAICYSTCTLLSNSLMELYNVTTFAMGGNPDYPSPVASLAGGTVTSLDSLIYSLEDSELNNHLQAPLPFKIRTTMRFTIREAYSHQLNQRPLEFTYLPAHYHLPYTATTQWQPVAIWEIIASQLKDSGFPIPHLH